MSTCRLWNILLVLLVDLDTDTVLDRYYFSFLSLEEDLSSLHLIELISFLISYRLGLGSGWGFFKIVFR